MSFTAKPRPTLRSAHGVSPADWRDDAACIGEPVETFFATSTLGSVGYIPPDYYDRARKICGSCPVLVECRAEFDRIEHRVIALGSLEGFVGGESPKERSQRRRAERRGAAQ